ncbi:hypothetical protein PM082_004787 [Marasmius tenuissimus]|nr:hypothetical protein PM082_004787 [Marasmius tenuissimus]
MSDAEEDFVKEIREAYFNACNFESLMRGVHIAVVVSALSKICAFDLVLSPVSLSSLAFNVVAVDAGKKSGPRRHITAFLIIFLFVLSTIHNAAFWAYVRRAFIAHGETAQSTASALNDYPTWFTGITMALMESLLDLEDMGGMGAKLAGDCSSHHIHDADDRP